jgi:molybdopterin/thiamine biosynthesis adenylyltransferase
MNRYVRQEMVIHKAGQHKLQNSSILIIGCGGLGCPIALYLASSGVGKLTLMDDDIVSLSNLHRQVLFTEQDIGEKKVTIARDKLKLLNSEVNISALDYRLDERNALHEIMEHDLVIVGCDNFWTRFIVSNNCYQTQTPYINASVLGDEGAISYYDNNNSCYQCNNPDYESLNNIPKPDDIGVLGAMVGVIGTAAATMAIEVLIGNQENYLNRHFVFDALTLQMKSFEIEQNDTCKLCS